MIVFSLIGILLVIPMIAHMGLLPVIALLLIVGLALRGIFICVNVMLDSFAGFFHVTRNQALVFHFCAVGTLLFPQLLLLWIVILSFQFPIKRDHA